MLCVDAVCRTVNGVVLRRSAFAALTPPQPPLVTRFLAALKLTPKRPQKAGRARVSLFRLAFDPLQRSELTQMGFECAADLINDGIYSLRNALISACLDEFEPLIFLACEERTVLLVVTFHVAHAALVLERPRTSFGSIRVARATGILKRNEGSSDFSHDRLSEANLCRKEADDFAQQPVPDSTETTSQEVEDVLYVFPCLDQAHASFKLLPHERCRNLRHPGQTSWYNRLPHLLTLDLQHWVSSQQCMAMEVAEGDATQRITCPELYALLPAATRKPLAPLSYPCPALADLAAGD